MPHSGSRDDNGEVFVGRADVEELVEWWQDQEEGWDSDAVLDEWDSVRTADGFIQVHATEFFSESAGDRPLDPEGQLLVWDRLVLLRDLRRAVHQVPVHIDRDYRQFAAWCVDQLENVIFIAGATVLLNNVSQRDLGVVPGMLLEMRARLTGGGWGLTSDGGAARLPCAEVRNPEGVPGGLPDDGRSVDTRHRKDDRPVCRRHALSVEERQRHVPRAGATTYVDVAGML